MSDTVYNWDTQLKIGEAGESILDAFMCPSYFDRVEKVCNYWWRENGVDRFAYFGEFKVSVEYKTDFRAAETDNLFLEVTRNTSTEAPGWFKTSLAQRLYYYIPPKGLIIEYDLATLKEIATCLDLPTVTCRNETYCSEGVLLRMSSVSPRAAFIDAPRYDTPENLVAGAGYYGS